MGDQHGHCYQTVLLRTKQTEHESRINFFRLTLCEVLPRVFQCVLEGYVTCSSFDASRLILGG